MQLFKWQLLTFNKKFLEVSIGFSNSLAPEQIFTHSADIQSSPGLDVSVRQNGMMTTSNGNICRVTGQLCGEFTGPRWIPRTKSSEAELWCFLWFAPNKRLRKQWWSWWFETPSCPLWRHRNGTEQPTERTMAYGAFHERWFHRYWMGIPIWFPPNSEQVIATGFWTRQDSCAAVTCTHIGSDLNGSNC